MADNITNPLKLYGNEGVNYGEGYKSSKSISTSIERVQYPSDLLENNDKDYANNTYGGNFIVFYIAEQNPIKLLTKEPTSSIPPEVTSTSSGTVASSSSMSTNAGTTGISRALKDTIAAIALYMPNQMSTAYSMDWTGVETADAKSAVTRVLDTGINSGVGAAAKEGINALTKVVLSRISTPIAQLMLGATANPKKEMMFKGVNFREFTLDFKMAPRNKIELDAVQRIIHLFKYHMHPEFGEGTGSGYLYIYPSEFEIVYYTNGLENTSMNRTTSCVLTKMNVNYTPNGNFSTFADGSPTEYSMQLSFMELATLTKREIGDLF